MLKWGRMHAMTSANKGTQQGSHKCIDFRRTFFRVLRF